MKRYVGRITTSLLAVCSALLVGCGSNSTSSIPTASGFFAQITNGYPGVVMVLLPNGAGFCSGTIVSQYAVLTANHCLLTQGTYTVEGPEGSVTTTQVVTNGSGSVDDTQDIGLLIFSQPIVQSQDNIYGVASQVSQGESVTIVGYGCDNPDTRDGGGIKRVATNDVEQKDASFLTLMTPVTSVQSGIIGDSSQGGTCFGDSGGPLFVSNGSQLLVAGATHAGGKDGSGKYYISEFVNIADNGNNHGFLQQMSNQYNLGIQFN